MTFLMREMSQKPSRKLGGVVSRSPTNLFSLTKAMFMVSWAFQGHMTDQLFAIPQKFPSLVEQFPLWVFQTNLTSMTNPSDRTQGFQFLNPTLRPGFTLSDNSTTKMEPIWWASLAISQIPSYCFLA